MLALRTATAVQHQQLEEQLDLLSPKLELARFESIIRCFAALYSSLEEQIDRAISPDLSAAINWPSRRKMPTLTADLELFDRVDNHAITVSPLTDDADVLGALYVVEGATLGGQLIGPHVEKLFPDYPVKIFSVYGAQAPQRWKAFRAVLNERLVEPAAISRAQHRAVQTFEQLARIERELRV